MIEKKEDNLILSYSSGRIGTFDSVITEDVSFKIAQGKSLALIGETGSGKTMTALSIMGLLPAGVEMNGGTISFIGRVLPKGKKCRKMYEITHVSIIFLKNRCTEKIKRQKLSHTMNETKREKKIETQKLKQAVRLTILIRRIILC